MLNSRLPTQSLYGTAHFDSYKKSFHMTTYNFHIFYTTALKSVKELSILKFEYRNRGPLKNNDMAITTVPSALCFLASVASII